jgi:SAM-dependent methyltransferase
MYLERKARNVLRGLLQAYGTTTLKKRLWNTEFSTGRWNCLETGVGDCVYPYVERYADNGSILDLGCGSGSTGNELDETTYRHYTGVDISDVALEKARRRTEQNGRADRSDYVQGEIFTHVPTQQYPLILFKDSIYYVPQGKIKAMLNRYSRYLTQRGVFIAKLSANEKYKAIVSIIESNFEVAEKYLCDQPPALVIVFRPTRTSATLAPNRVTSASDLG